MELLVEPESVRGVQPSTLAENGIGVLIHWKNLPSFEETWEDYTTIVTQFPLFNLEDKVDLWVAGNVRPPIVFTYARRKKDWTAGTCQQQGR